MQLQIEEHVDHETTVKNDPIEPLKAIHVLMNNPARAKCPCASVLAALLQAVQFTKQKDDKNLIDCITGFKSAKNVLKSHVGSQAPHQFVEHAVKCHTEMDTKIKQDMNDESFDSWMAFLLIRNSHQNECWSLVTGLLSQQSMGNNQHPKSITAATDILANHKFDDCNPKKRNKGKSGDDTMSIKDEDKEKKDTPNEQSFVQGKVTCCCCGKDKHKSPNCPDKDKIPKD